MRDGVVRRLRCAVYTRKSTEEGLDMAFNSLDAQREACHAFIASQKPEGYGTTMMMVGSRVAISTALP